VGSEGCWWEGLQGWIGPAEAGWMTCICYPCERVFGGSPWMGHWESVNNGAGNTHPLYDAMAMVVITNHTGRKSVPKT
jgi:hypothetical protein